MSEKVISQALFVLVVIVTFISLGFLYIKYIVLQDYEILYLSEEEAAIFIEENSVPEEEAEPAESEEVVEEEPEEPLLDSENASTSEEIQEPVLVE